MSFNIFLDTTCAPCTPLGTGEIFVRDNFSDSSDPSSIPAVVGYTFSIVTGNGDLGLFMRGPVLDIVTGPGPPAGPGHPTTPDPRLASLALSIFQVCVNGVLNDCDRLFLEGDIRSVNRVPEPGTLALLAIAIAGLAWPRRLR